MGTTSGRAAVRMGDWKLMLNASETDAEEAADGADRLTRQDIPPTAFSRSDAKLH